MPQTTLLSRTTNRDGSIRIHDSGFSGCSMAVRMTWKSLATISRVVCARLRGAVRYGDLRAGPGAARPYLAGNGDSEQRGRERARVVLP